MTVPVILNTAKPIKASADVLTGCQKPVASTGIFPSSKPAISDPAERKAASLGIAAGAPAGLAYVCGMY